LHFKQDAGSKATSWIKCLACGIIQQLGPDNAETLFTETELSLFTTSTLKPISHSSIQPACLICPNSSVCLTKDFKRHFLKQNTPSRDFQK